MLSLGVQESNTQKYTVTTRAKPNLEVIIEIASMRASYTLDEQLGAGAYGTVHTLKRLKRSTDISDAILYQTDESIDTRYVMKQMYDVALYNFKLNTQTQADLWSPRDISFFASHSFLFAEETFVSIIKDVEYQMAIEEALREEIERKQLIDQFLTYKLAERETMLQEAKVEAHYTTRYYVTIGGNAIVLEGQPNVTAAFNCELGYMSIQYQPAIAVLMPHVFGVTLNDYPGKYLKNAEVPVSFTSLLTLFLSVINEFISLHELNILHLDANLANIMFDPEKNQVRLIDFGMAKDKVDGNGNPPCIAREIIDKPYEYWRKDRIRLQNSEESYATVGIEDDAFSLATGLYHLVGAYQHYVEKIVLAACLMDYLSQIREILDQPKVHMSDVLLSMRQVITLTVRLMELQENRSPTEEQIQHVSFALEEVSAHVGPENRLAVEAKKIRTKAQSCKVPSIETLLTQRKGTLPPAEFQLFARNLPDRNQHMLSKKPCLFSIGAFQPVDKNSRKRTILGRKDC